LHRHVVKDMHHHAYVAFLTLLQIQIVFTYNHYIDPTQYCTSLETNMSTTEFPVVFVTHGA